MVRRTKYKTAARVSSVRNRKQIGKFEISKAPTYAIAGDLTYITRNDQQILSVTLDYTQFRYVQMVLVNQLCSP